MALDVLSDKLPPQSLEAEQAVLGAILIENNAILKCIETLVADDFYRDAHKRIYKAMIELFDHSEPIDIVTVKDHLSNKGELETVGGPMYLATLANQIATAANVRHHALIVGEKALLRALLRTGTDIASKVYEDTLEAKDLMDFAEKSIFDISERHIKSDFSPMREIIDDSFKAIQELYKNKETITGVPSGFTDIDEMTSGFQKGDLVVIGGRPSMGKTAFALNIAQYVGMVRKEPVAVFSLEMSKQQLAFRLLCSEAMIDSNKVRKGFINQQGDWTKLTQAASRLIESQIFIDDTSAVSVLEMRAKARRFKKEHGLSMLVVDYLQLMRGREKSENRVQEISDISRSLKALAKELEVPVLALSQLNRSVETRPTKDKHPTLADLRESGAIEQDADVIIFLYRPEVYNRDDQDLKGRAEIIIAKQRNGPTGIVRLTYINYCTKFVNAQSEESYLSAGEESFD